MTRRSSCTFRRKKRRHISLEKDAYPYLPLADQDGKRLFVSLWGKSAVAVLDLQTLQVSAQWATGPHPTEMGWSNASISLSMPVHG